MTRFSWKAHWMIGSRKKDACIRTLERKITSSGRSVAIMTYRFEYSRLGWLQRGGLQRQNSLKQTVNRRQVESWSASVNFPSSQLLTINSAFVLSCLMRNFHPQAPLSHQLVGLGLLKSADTDLERYDGLWPEEVSLQESVFSVAMESQVGKPKRPTVPKQWMGENLDVACLNNADLKTLLRAT